MSLVAQVTLAILLSNPYVPRSTATTYAEAIVVQHEKRAIDPYTFVAIITHESNWNSSVVAAPKTDPQIGLGQIRARNHPTCSNLSSSECREHIAALKNGVYNIRQMGALITSTRKFCRNYKQSKNAWYAEWLSMYQGYGGKDGAYCLWKKHPKKMRRLGSHPRYRIATPHLTKRVMRYRRCIMKKVKERAKPKKGQRGPCWHVYGR